MADESLRRNNRVVPQLPSLSPQHPPIQPFSPPPYITFPAASQWHLPPPPPSRLSLRRCLNTPKRASRNQNGPSSRPTSLSSTRELARASSRGGILLPTMTGGQSGSTSSIFCGWSSASKTSPWPTLAPSKSTKSL
jgi:hypothetical protein